MERLLQHPWHDLMCRRTAGAFKVDGMSRGDLLQECRLRLLDAVPKWDPALATWPTFLTRCLTNRMIDLIRMSRSQIRNAERQVESIEDVEEEEGIRSEPETVGSRINLLSTIDQILENLETGDLEPQVALFPPRHVVQMIARIVMREMADGESHSEIRDRYQLPKAFMSDLVSAMQVAYVQD